MSGPTLRIRELKFRETGAKLAIFPLYVGQFLYASCYFGAYFGALAGVQNVPKWAC